MSLIFNKKIKLYGRGDQVRDWIYVEDHVNALKKIFMKGKIGENYNVGSNNPIKNIDLVKIICSSFFKLNNFKKRNFRDHIEFVIDRPGHDKKYLINPRKIEKELKWKSIFEFKKAIHFTVKWYIDNQKWWKKIYERKLIKRMGLRIKK